MHRLFGTALGVLLLALAAQGASLAAGLKDYEVCITNRACSSGTCAAGRCIPAAGLATGRVCDKDVHCQSRACLADAQGSKVCSAQPKVPQGSLLDGEVCKAGAECQSKFCVNRAPYPNLCAATKLLPGVFCTIASDCMFGSCAIITPGSLKKYCTMPGAGLNTPKARDLEPCDDNRQCASGSCDWASGERTLKRCIPQIKLTSGSACYDNGNCASETCAVVGTQSEKACR